MSEGPQEKKIIIDEDWKSQVQAEKEAAEKQRDEPPQAQPSEQPGPEAMPPASFSMLLTTLATEAMVALGQLPHPATNQPSVQLEPAKFFIDTLEVLQVKTQGNLTPEEQQGLDETLHHLRLAFVAVKQAPPAAGSTPEERE